MSAAVAPEGRSPRYLRKLLFLLSAATFFEGYDGFVLGFVLPTVLVSFHVSTATGGIVFAIIKIGSIVAFLLAAQADRIGRRRLLLFTIAGYTVATALTAVSQGIVWLASAQFVAQIFLGAEFAVAITIVVEEFPAHRRGRSLGILTGMGTLGGITVGLLGFLGLGTATALTWRAYYVVGLIPLVIIWIARRSLDESSRYVAVRSSPADAHLNHTSIWEPWKRPYRRNVVAVGTVNFFRSAVATAAIVWWSTYAATQVGMSERTRGLYLAIAGFTGVLGYIVSGRLMDRIGRRTTLILYMGPAMVFGMLAFQLHAPVPLLIALCGGIFFGLGSGATTTAFSTELFPTYVRGRASTWCRNAFEVAGSIVGPLLVGVLGDPHGGALGSIGNAMTLLFPVCVIPVIFVTARYLPETRDVNFEEMDARASGIGAIRIEPPQVS
jgi:putative MFS transporter